MKRRALLSFVGAWLLTLVGGRWLLFPQLTVIVAFFWFLHRPSDLPWPYVMGLALLEGILDRIPLVGGNALLFLIVYIGALVMRHYIHARSFSVVWMFFGALSFVMALVDWRFYLLWGGASLGTFLLKALATVLWFPYVWRLLWRMAALL